MYRFICLSGIILVLAYQLPAQKDQVPAYPFSHKIDQVDDYHGTQVADPYRWLENENSEETGKWIKAQNELTFALLDKIPFRDKIKSRLEDLVNYPRESAPIRAGNYYLYYANSGLQNQSVLYIKEGLEGKPDIFLDPNSLASDGTVSVRIAGISNDEKHLALSISEAGSDWSTLVVMNVANKKPTGDTMRWVKFSGANWYKDGFFYSRYPAPEKGTDLTAANQFHTVYYHKLGQPQKNDKVIFQDKEHPRRYHNVDVTEDEEFLILYIAEGTDGYECHVKDLRKANSAFKALFTGFEGKSGVIDHREGKFFVRTNVSAPNYRLISIPDSVFDSKNWKDVIPESRNLLQGISTAGNVIFARYLEKAQSKVYRMKYDGSGKSEIPLPSPGTANGFGGKKEDTLVYYSFSSFTHPGSTYTYSLNTGKSSVYYEPELKFNPDDFDSKQVTYSSKDGTEISMFIVYKKGLELNGKNPTLLYGYGGFNISLTPGFKSSHIPWLESGGVFAMPNLRGGGEYGEEWHQGGMLEQKQNVFDDFIAAAEYLIETKYTSSEKMVISGRSNGGLLVGAVMAQRPELFAVALPGVGVMDMLRYDQFTVGHGWVPEYGSSSNPNYFKILHAYSPLHNLHDSVNYPATLVYTADHDDRVVPAHSFKFTARLQAVQSGTKPVVIRIETKAGHGGGKPTSKVIEEEADKLAFALYYTGSGFN